MHAESRRPLSVLLFAWLGLILAGSHPPAWALSDAEIEERIEEALSHRHPQDGASFWKGLGSEAPRVVRAMLAKTTSTYHRVRLIEAMGYFEDAVSREEIQRLLTSTETQAIRIAATRAAGRNPALLEGLVRVLSDVDPQLRLTAARVLKNHPSPEAKAKLEEFLQQEKLPWVVAGVKGGTALSDLTRGGQLVPSSVSASQEDSLKTCAGDWEGVLIHPKAGKIGLHTLPLRLEVPVRGPARFQVLLPIPSRFAVGGVIPRAGCVGGVLKMTGPALWSEAIQVFDRSVSGAPTGRALPTEWVLLISRDAGQESGEAWLESRAPGGSRIILRKSSR